MFALTAVKWRATSSLPRPPCTSNHCRAEAAYYPADKTLIVINNTEACVETTVSLPDGNWLNVSLAPLETKEIAL